MTFVRLALTKQHQQCRNYYYQHKFGRYNFEKKCWFSGGFFHPRLKCPAKSSECNNCGKVGHWSKVCQSADKKKITSLASNEDKYSSINAAVPNCLKSAEVEMKINGMAVPGIIDTASSDSCIDYETLMKLNIKYTPCTFSITVASSSSLFIAIC